MSSLDEHFSPLVGFFKDLREDDENSNAALSELRDAIQKELSDQLGRSRADFRVWQDRVAIAHGDNWEKEINQAISQLVSFIPIITPRAIRRPFCAFEFKTFLAREAALGREDLIFPILYIPLHELEDQRWRTNEVLKIVQARQFLDWTNLRSDKLADPKVRAEIIKFCKSVSKAMLKPWVPPEERRRQQELEVLQRNKATEAEQQAQEERRRRQEEIERRTKLEEDKRKADEAEQARLLEERSQAGRCRTAHAARIGVRGGQAYRHRRSDRCVPCRSSREPPRGEAHDRSGMRGERGPTEPLRER